MREGRVVTGYFSVLGGRAGRDAELWYDAGRLARYRKRPSWIELGLMPEDE